MKNCLSSLLVRWNAARLYEKVLTGLIHTGEDNIVEMTKSFDVLTELPLYTQEFGQG